MSTGKTTLALLLSALLPAGAAWAAGNDTLVYCSEASPESFNPQIASSGPSFVASSQVLYNRLVSFDPVKNTPIPSLATEWHVSEDGKTSDLYSASGGEVQQQQILQTDPRF